MLQLALLITLTPFPLKIQKGLYHGILVFAVEQATFKSFAYPVQQHNTSRIWYGMRIAVGGQDIRTQMRNKSSGSRLCNRHF